LKDVAISCGTPETKIDVVGNGVDLDKFHALPRLEARRVLGLPREARILVSVGGLVERKGFHRVIRCLPALRAKFPDLRYLIVGGASPEGDNSKELHALVAKLGLGEAVMFLGPLNPEELKLPLSAADAFVLATRYEGWANVFLEAMACGLPVVTTDVGGNGEVICRPDLGTIVPFADEVALRCAIQEALTRKWNRQLIVEYARSNSWDHRVELLVRHFQEVVSFPAMGANYANRAS
jgi:teichuronic acid biosynthesis glycosyltransferase TuaC